MTIISVIQGDYEHSRELFDQALEYLKFDHPSNVYMQCAKVFLAIVSNDYELARNNLYDALTGTDAYNWDTWTLTVTLIPFILHHDGDDILAVEILGLGFGQRAHYLNWVKAWDLLMNLQRDLEHELGIDTYKATWERGAQRDLDKTIAELQVYLGADAPSPKSQPLAEPLTERELEVLALIADGMTNPQIAEKLYLSVGTVKVHTRNIYGKLNVSNRTEASTIARKLNLI